MANDGDEIALAAGFDPQHAKTVLGVVEGDAVDETGQDLSRARRRYYCHARIMQAVMSGFQNSVGRVSGPALIDRSPATLALARRRRPRC